MPTRMLTTLNDRLGERMSMALRKVESRPVKILEDEDFVSRHQKYKESALYTDVVDYLEKGPLSLEGIPRNRQRQIIWKAKKYKLSSPNKVPSLRYQENNGSFSLCVVESEIERFLSMAHKDHSHYSSELSLSF